MSQNISQLFNVSKKTILITGASGYLGREIASLFSINGAQVLLLGRSKKTFDVADQIRAETGSDQIYPFQVDFYNRNELQAVTEQLISQFQINVLINNAYDMGPQTGFNTETGRLENLGFAEWQHAFESGIFWAFYLSQKIGETMKKEGGSIINVSSMYGVVSPDPALYEGTSFFNPAPYSVMKSGIIAMTRYFASFWASHNIRCNAISPGPFSNTQSTSQNSVTSQDPFLERVKNKTLLKRVGRPEELGGAFLLLASDAGAYITGQNIIVDGGWTVP